MVFIIHPRMNYSLFSFEKRNKLIINFYYTHIHALQNYNKNTVYVWLGWLGDFKMRKTHPYNKPYKPYIF